MSTLQAGTNCVTLKFKLTVSSLYPIKLKLAQNNRSLTAVRFVEQIVTNCRRKSFNVLLFSYLLETSFSSLLTIFLHFYELLSKIHVQTEYG